MKCPQCNEELMIEINDYQTGTDKQDVEFVCENEHRYSARIKVEDLIEGEQ